MLVGDVKPVKKVEDPYCKATENIPGDLGRQMWDLLHFKPTLDWLDFSVR